MFQALGKLLFWLVSFPYITLHNPTPQIIFFIKHIPRYMFVNFHAIQIDHIIIKHAWNNHSHNFMTLKTELIDIDKGTSRVNSYCSNLLEILFEMQTQICLHGT